MSFDDQLWEGIGRGLGGELLRIPASMAGLPRIHDGETFEELARRYFEHQGR